VQELSPELAEMFGVKENKGVIVAFVESNSPAEKAGLQAKDVILRMNGKDVESAAHFALGVKTAHVGQTMDLVVLRDGAQKNVQATIAAVSTKMAASEKLGIEVAALDAVATRRYGYPDRTPGVVVTHVDENGRAASGGLEEGDVIIGINKQNTPNLKAYGELLEKFGAGDRLVLHVMRGRQHGYMVVSLK